MPVLQIEKKSASTKNYILLIEIYSCQYTNLLNSIFLLSHFSSMKKIGDLVSLKFILIIKENN